MASSHYNDWLPMKKLTLQRQNLIQCWEVYWIRKCSLWLEQFLLQVQLVSATLWDIIFCFSFKSGYSISFHSVYHSGSSSLKNFLASATDVSSVSAPLREFAVYLYLFMNLSHLLTQQVVQSGLPFSLSVHLLPHELAYLVVESWCMYIKDLEFDCRWSSNTLTTLTWIWQCKSSLSGGTSKWYFPLFLTEEETMKPCHLLHI